MYSAAPADWAIRTLVWKSYSSAEIQSVYATGLADCAKYIFVSVISIHYRIKRIKNRGFMLTSEFT